MCLPEIVEVTAMWALVICPVAELAWETSAAPFATDVVEDAEAEGLELPVDEAFLDPEPDEQAVRPRAVTPARTRATAGVRRDARAGVRTERGIGVSKSSRVRSR
jgi:hypothetical protein